MQIITKVTIAAVVFIIAVETVGCGGPTISSKPPDEDYARIAGRWLGTYTGTVVYTYGDITDKKGGEGFPATLVLSEHKGLIVFELTTHQQPISWFFFLPPSAFTASSLEFIRNAVHLGTEYQFKVALSRSEKELNGTMKMFSLIPSGAYTPRGSYFMSFTKQEF